MSEATEPTADRPAPPALRVVRGTPTEDELAALVAVLAARGSGGEASDGSGDDSRPNGWRSRSNGLRRPLSTGPAAWRSAPWLR